ncbi:hypothetical protein [Candidatus Nitrospira salsa]
MDTKRFRASVQYNDWKGTSAADSADGNGPGKWLTDNGHKEGDEFLLGVSISVGENRRGHEGLISVDFLLSPGNHDHVKAMIDSSQGPVEVRKVSVEMKLTEFFGLFKRFSIALSPHGMLSERDYTDTE